MKANSEKLSISLPGTMVQFVKNYQIIHDYKTKSEVFQDAIRLLRRKELESEYAQANLEIDPAYDTLSGEGLEDEAW